MKRLKEVSAPNFRRLNHTWEETTSEVVRLQVGVEESTQFNAPGLGGEKFQKGKESPQKGTRLLIITGIRSLS